MSVAREPNGPATGTHAGQWGLAAVLISSLLLILFPMMVLLLFASMVGAYNNEFLESRDLDLGIAGGWVVIGTFGALAGFSLVFAIVAVAVAKFRGQPLGLPVAGTIMSLVSVAAMVVLFLAALRTSEWLRWLQKERFERGILYPHAPARRSLPVNTPHNPQGPVDHDPGDIGKQK